VSRPDIFTGSSVSQPRRPLSQPILLWDYRLWGGSGPLESTGTVGGPTTGVPLWRATNGGTHDRFSHFTFPVDERIPLSASEFGGPLSDEPITLMVAVSTPLSKKLGSAFVPAVLAGGGDSWQGFGQFALVGIDSGFQPNIACNVFVGGSAFFGGLGHYRFINSMYVVDNATPVYVFDTNSLATGNVEHMLVSFSADMWHGGATVFRDLDGANNLAVGQGAVGSPVYPGVASHATFDDWLAGAGSIFAGVTLGPFYRDQPPEIARPISGGVGVHSLPGVLPTVFGFAFFRGELSREDLEYWRDHWFPPGQAEADLPYPNSIVVGAADRTPGSTPPEATVTIPANTYSIICNIVPALGHFPIRGRLDQVVIEVACQPGDQIRIVAGNRGSRFQSDGGVGGLPDGGAAGVNSANGYHGLSGAGSTRIHRNGVLVAVIGGSGGGYGGSSTGDDVTGQTVTAGGGGPGFVGLNGAAGGQGTFDHGGGGGSQTAGGKAWPPSGFVAGDGAALQGGFGANHADSGSSGTLLGLPGGGGGWFGGGGSSGGFGIGGGGGSSWIDESAVQLILSKHVTDNAYPLFTVARNAVVYASWGRQAPWSPTALGPATVRSGTPDPSFAGGAQTTSGFTGRVWSAAVQPDNRIVIGGEFMSVLGVDRNNIARLNADGTLDTGFNFGADPGMTGEARSIALQSDGKIVVGGLFINARTVEQNRIARFNTDGTLDTGFNTGADPGTSGPILAVAVQSDGKIIIGGGFATARGVTQNNIARLNADGTLDAGFNTGSDIGTNGGVNAIAIQSDGKIVIAGDFTTARGVTQNRIARLNTDGTLDTGFNTGGTVGVNNTVRAAVIDPAGNILIGGSFSTVRGVSRFGFDRLLPDGTRDATVTSPGMFNVASIAIDGAGRVFVGAADVSTNPRWIRQLNVDGTSDPWFNSHAIFEGGDAVSGDVRTIVPIAGHLLVGGVHSVLLPGGGFRGSNFSKLILTDPPT
jgi:uncharacterized delta-60 repeat protein